MMNIYNLCLKICENSNFQNKEIQERFDVLYLMGRLNNEQYKTLCGLLKQDNTEEELVEEILIENDIIE